MYITNFFTIRKISKSQIVLQEFRHHLRYIVFTSINSIFSIQSVNSQFRILNSKSLESFKVGDECYFDLLLKPMPSRKLRLEIINITRKAFVRDINW